MTVVQLCLVCTEINKTEKCRLTLCGSVMFFDQMPVAVCCVVIVYQESSSDHPPV